MSPSVQARANRWRRYGFSGRDTCLLWGFEGHPLKLDRGPSGAGYGHPLKSDLNSGHSWPDCGNIDWKYFGAGIVCSGVGVGSRVWITGGAYGIAYCRSLAMDSTALVVVYP